MKRPRLCQIYIIVQMDKKSHIYLKFIRSDHTNQKWQQKVSNESEAKG